MTEDGGQKSEVRDQACDVTIAGSGAHGRVCVAECE